MSTQIYSLKVKILQKLLQNLVEQETAILLNYQNVRFCIGDKMSFQEEEMMKN